MSILNIARMGDPILRASTRTVDRREIRTPAMRALVDDMIATMADCGAIGLPAPQVHHDLRLFVATIGDTQGDTGNVIVLFNPMVTAVDDIAEVWEGCSSIPGIAGPCP